MGSMSLEKKIIMFGVPALAIALGIIFYFLGNAAPANPNTNAANAPTLRQYVNPDFKIALQYPASWAPIAGRDAFNKIPLYFKGSDGFFGIDAIGADASGKVAIDDVVRSLISAAGNPYGASPTVTTPDTGSVQAKLIVPSADQPFAKNGEAALIVRYPKPVAIGANTFLFFMLYGDKTHLANIANTLQLIQ